MEFRQIGHIIINFSYIFLKSKRLEEIHFEAAVPGIDKRKTTVYLFL